MTRDRILRRLAHYDEATVTELAPTMQMTPAGIGKSLARLVEKGLVERIRVSNSNAGCRYRLTEAGKAAAKEAA